MARTFRQRIGASPSIITIIYLFVTFLLFLLSILINSLLRLPTLESPLLFILGIVLIVVGLSFRYSSLKRLLTINKSIEWRYVPGKLIKDGVFRYSRNPTYLGILLMFLGALLLVINLPMLIVLIIAFAVFNRQVSYEEKVIAKRFGKEYSAYKKKTRRWL